MTKGKNILDLTARLSKQSAKPVDRFTGIEEVTRQWFYEPDVQAIRVTTGVIESHYMLIGDPTWLFVVAPPGTGKTTVSIMAAANLPGVVPLGEFTQSSFLSGFYGSKEPGLLEKLGDIKESQGTYTTTGDAVLLAKDFTTVLSMRRETRAGILAQLREIHDGEFRRAFGTGETKIWRGRITIIAAVTPIIDRHYSVFTVLGERFLQVRWHRPNSPEAGQRAIQQEGSEMLIREELQAAIRTLFKGVAAQDLQDSFRVALDCISDNRRRLLVTIAQNGDVNRLRLPRTVADREIQELQALGLITEELPYTLTQSAARLLEEADVVWQGVPLMK